MAEFFDPIKRLQLVHHLRGRLEILKNEIALLEEVQLRTGTHTDMLETYRLAAQLEEKISLLEQRYTTVH